MASLTYQQIKKAARSGQKRRALCQEAEKRQRGTVRVLSARVSRGDPLAQATASPGSQPGRFPGCEDGSAPGDAPHRASHPSPFLLVTEAAAGL